MRVVKKHKPKLKEKNSNMDLKLFNRERTVLYVFLFLLFLLYHLLLSLLLHFCFCVWVENVWEREWQRGKQWNVGGKARFWKCGEAPNMAIECKGSFCCKPWLSCLLQSMGWTTIKTNMLVILYVYNDIHFSHIIYLKWISLNARGHRLKRLIYV